MIINNIQFNVDCMQILTDLQTVLKEQGIPYLHNINDSGEDIMITCPYHGNGHERRPSAGIRKSDGTFHCFACGEVHSLPEVISYCFGENDFYGMKWLLKHYVTTDVEERKDIKLDFNRNKPQVTKDIKYVREEELDKYRYYHPYWTKRGITDDDIIELFDLGYDQSSDCITFPVRDINGNCLFVARRSVTTKWFNYPKDADKPLYGLYELSQVIDYRRGNHKNHLYITESMIDCILLWQAGKYAVALNGTGSKEQIETLKKLPIRHYVLATDNDSAGLKAREKLRKAFPNKLITEIDFPDGIKDIGECTNEEIKNIDKWEVF